jgi:hypothetical protein
VNALAFTEWNRFVVENERRENRIVAGAVERGTEELVKQGEKLRKRVSRHFMSAV